MTERLRIEHGGGLCAQHGRYDEDEADPMSDHLHLDGVAHGAFCHFRSKAKRSYRRYLY